MSKKQHIVIADEFTSLKPELENIEELFLNAPEIIQTGRNIIKGLCVDRHHLVVKSFKCPGRLRGLIYRRFRKSKAQRSYEYAHKLASIGFSTPTPVAYIEERGPLSVSNSYFISLYLPHDFSIREALTRKIDDCNQVIDHFIQFTFELHNAGILHLDHSPGNTLVKRSGNDYTFSLVDINRLRFADCDLTARLDNLARLTQNTDTISAMAYRYAELAGAQPDVCFKHIEAKTKRHFKRLAFRRRLKNRLRHSQIKK